MKLKLNYDGDVQTIPLDDVVSVELTRGMSLDPNFTASDEETKSSLSGDAAREVLQLVLFDKPFQPGGVPAAIVTGRLSIAFARDNQQEERTFIIYNDRLLQDAVAPDTFYNCRAGFGDTLETLL